MSLSLGEFLVFWHTAFFNPIAVLIFHFPTLHQLTITQENMNANAKGNTGDMSSLHV